MKQLIFTVLLGCMTLTGCAKQPTVISDTGAVSTAALPTSITIVLDTSGSMNDGSGTDRISRIIAAKTVIADWVKTAPNGVVWTLFTFDKATPLVAYTSNKDLILKSLEPVQANGGTPLLDTCKNAYAYMQARSTKIASPENAILLVITDGIDSTYNASQVANELSVMSKAVSTYMIGFDSNDPVYTKSVSNFSYAKSAATLKASLDDIPLEK
jgi:Mg-chelatase subunit ChlD